MNVAPLGTQRFVCFTAANPARVWAVLTGTHETGSYLYGLVTHSSWEADAPIHFQTTQSPRAVHSSLTGRVLHVQPLCRLSYLVQSGPEDPPVYLTWQIRPCQGGSTIRLQIDEIEYADNDEEAENTWLPVLAALQALLARDEPALPGSSRTEMTSRSTLLGLTRRRK
jgi:hypothetical protein